MPKRILTLQEYLARHGFHSAFFSELDKAGNPIEVQRWVKVLPFKPNSSQQVLAYIKHRGHKVPTTLKGGKETTVKAEIEKLAEETGDPLYPLILEDRSLLKLLTNEIPNWEPDHNGRVHTHFGYYPAQGQLDTREPNIQNASKHTKLGPKFRGVVRARPGHKIVELDKAGFHAIMMGREAHSHKYMDLARRDIHSFVGSYLDPPSIPYELLRSNEGEFMDRLARFKRDHKHTRDYIAKKAILGIQFGLGYKKLFWLNKTSFETEAYAKKVIELILGDREGRVEGLFGEVRQYQRDIRLQAHRQGYLINNFNFIRWFTEVLAWKKYGQKWMPRPGAESEEAIAFMPASNAHCMIKEEVLDLYRSGACEKYNFINWIHDSLMFEPPLSLLEECINVVHGRMIQPCLRLADPEMCPSGLSVGVDVLVGDCWRDYHPEEAKDGMRKWDLERGDYAR